MAKKSAGLPSLSERSCNRIWIELERDPKGYACTPEMLLTFREQQVELANNLLQRLQPEGTKTGMAFWWNSSKGMYSLTTSEAGTYTDLSDSGYWFNLDHLGRK
jgi:hypothetical protein